MDDYAIFEEIFGPQKGGWVSVSLQFFSYEVLVYVINGYKYVQHTQSEKRMI